MLKTSGQRTLSGACVALICSLVRCDRSCLSSGTAGAMQCVRRYATLARNVDSPLRRRIASRASANPNAFSTQRRVALLLQRPTSGNGADSAQSGGSCATGPVTRSHLASILFDPVLDLDDDGVVGDDEINALWTALKRDSRARSAGKLADGKQPPVAFSRVVALYQLLQLNPHLRRALLSGDASAFNSRSHRVGGDGRRRASNADRLPVGAQSTGGRSDIANNSNDGRPNNHTNTVGGTAESDLKGMRVDSFFFAGDNDWGPPPVRARHHKPTHS